MLKYNRIDASEGIDVTRVNVSSVYNVFSVSVAFVSTGTLIK